MDYSTIVMLASELYARRDKLHYLFERRTIHTGELSSVFKDINDAIDFIFNIRSEINSTDSEDDIRRLESEADSKQGELSLLESECASLESELQNIESEISYVESEISGLESDLYNAESMKDDD